MYAARTVDETRPVSGLPSLNRGSSVGRGGFAPSRTYSARRRIESGEHRSKSSLAGRMPTPYVEANSQAMFSPVFRNSRGVSGGTSPRTQWRTPSPYGTASWAHERAQTPRPELPLKCQNLYIDVDNCTPVAQRTGSAVAEAGRHNRPGYGSEWLTPNQLASRQHTRHMREISAQSPRQYSYLIRTPPASPRSPRTDKKGHHPNISLKHLLTAVMSRTPGVNANIRRNYVCFKLQDDKKTPKSVAPEPANDNKMVDDKLTMSDHLGVTISRTCGPDMCVEVESFSVGAGTPTRDSPDLNRSQRSVRFSVSTHVREYQPSVPLAV